MRYIVGVILILSAYAFFAWLVFVFADPPHYDHVNWPEKQWVIERHKYHGIDVSIEERGQHYFIREGKRCRL